MYLQTSRLQYNLQGSGVFQTARSDKFIQAFACNFYYISRLQKYNQKLLPQKRIALTEKSPGTIIFMKNH